MSDVIGRDDICTNCGAGHCDRCMGERLRTARAEGYEAGRRKGVEDALALPKVTFPGLGPAVFVDDVRALLSQPEPRVPRAELDALGEQGAREKREYERRLAVVGACRTCGQNLVPDHRCPPWTGR